jgi:hypothetical protein
MRLCYFSIIHFYVTLLLLLLIIFNNLINLKREFSITFLIFLEIIVIMGCDMSFLKKGGKNLGIDSNGEGVISEKRILLLGLDNAGKTSILF